MTRANKAAAGAHDDALRKLASLVDDSGQQQRSLPKPTIRQPKSPANPNVKLGSAYDFNEVSD